MKSLRRKLRTLVTEEHKHLPMELGLRRRARSHPFRQRVPTPRRIVGRYLTLMILLETLVSCQFFFITAPAFLNRPTDTPFSGLSMQPHEIFTALLQALLSPIYYCRLLWLSRFQGYHPSRCLLATRPRLFYNSISTTSLLSYLFSSKRISGRQWTLSMNLAVDVSPSLLTTLLCGWC